MKYLNIHHSCQFWKWWQLPSSILFALPYLCFNTANLQAAVITCFFPIKGYVVRNLWRTLTANIKFSSPVFTVNSLVFCTGSVSTTSPASTLGSPTWVKHTECIKKVFCCLERRGLLQFFLHNSLFYSSGMKESVRREERSLLKSLLRDGKENKCSEIKMQMEGDAFVLWLGLQECPQGGRELLRGVNHLSEELKAQHWGVQRCSNRGWAENFSCSTGPGTIPASWYNSNIPKKFNPSQEWTHPSVHRGDRALMGYTEKKTEEK